MKSNKTTGRIFGSFFLIAFLAYGIGFGMVESITNVPNSLSSILENQSIFIVGGILMAVVHTIVNLGLAVTVVPLLKQSNQVLAHGYLSAAIISTLLLLIGAIFLQLLLPLSESYFKADDVNASSYETIAGLLKKANFLSYQIGMAIWGIGGLLFCYLMGKLNRIPRVFVIWGLIGYVIFIAGTFAELFGIKIGVLLSMPGGLFEITLSIWLIVKGFKEPFQPITV